MADQPALQDPNLFPGLIAHSGTADTADIIRVLATTDGALHNHVTGGTVTAALSAGTNAIGKLAANSGVDIGDVTLTASTASVGAVKDDGPQTAGTYTFTSSADMSTAADIGPAPTSTQKSILLQATISAAVAMEFTLQMETTAGAERVSFFLPANGSIIFIPRHPIKLGTADKKWQGKASVAGNVRVHTTTRSEA